MRTRGLTRRVAVAAFVLGVALVVGLAAGGGTVAAQSAPDCSTVGFTQNASGYYEVTNVDQLQCVGNASSGVALDDDYVQTSDIDASETSTWHGGDGFRPISERSGDFNGTFDGNGFEIADLTINRPNGYRTGLFAAAGAGAVITDVTLVRADVTGTNATGGLVGENAGEVRGASVDGTVTGVIWVGGLVGDNHGEVSDATSSADVTGDGNIVGGLIGSNYGDVSEATASADVTGDSGVGGLIGESSAPVSNAAATGNVTGDSRVGGLIGNTFGGEVADSTASGEVTGVNDVGGLIGDNSDEVTDSTASGDVTGDSFVGGLIGDNSDEVTDSTADGNVTGDGNDVGGLIGVHKLGRIEGSTAAGPVSGNSRVGGLVGSNLNQTITTSNATGDVTASGQQVGGLVGLNYGFSGTAVRESFATGNVSGGNETGGLVGKNLDDTIVDSYALGDVEGNDNVGCLVGNNTGSDSSVETSYAACSVAGSNDVGGLIGTTEDGATVTDSYWDTDEDGSTSDGGEGLPTANMTGEDARSNMTGFDFTSTWFAAKDSYPELSSNTRSSRQRADDGDGSTDEPDTPTPTSPEDTPGFGAVVTVLALLGAALLAHRRRDGAA